MPAVRLSPRGRRLLVVIALFVVVWVALRLVDQPGTAVSMYSLVPILLTVYWFDIVAGLGAAVVATGDFYLVVPGPAGCTTIVVGDVVGHGLEAARRAAFVRAALATFARFSSDPVQLLQLANAAQAEGSDDDTRFVTAVCLTIGTPPELEVRWAAAGHDVPWYLDTGDPLAGGRISAPLGVGPQALTLEAGTATLQPGSGILAFTDGLVEGRPANRPRSQALELFGEDRARSVLESERGATPARVLDALVAAMSAFAGGALADDVCLVAVRAT